MVRADASADEPVFVGLFSMTQGSFGHRAGPRALLSFLSLFSMTQGSFGHQVIAHCSQALAADRQNVKAWYRRAKG